MEDIIRPFIPHDAFSWFEEYIKPDMRIFEYGSGMSTLWFGKNATEVIAVENSKLWFDTVNEKLKTHNIDNVQLLFKEDGGEYSKLIHNYDGLFDIVFVDGRFRMECMKECFDKAKYAIFMDNTDADHYQNAFDVMKSYKNGTIKTFSSYGLNPYTGEDQPAAWQASVFLKEI